MHYIDIHCHILPGVDDGAKSPKEAREMLQIAWEEGIRRVILTPHYYPGEFMIEPDTYRCAFEDLSAWQKEYLPGMKLYCGNEVCLAKGDISSALYDRRILSMAGSNYMLVEFDTDVSLPEMKRELIRLRGMGFWPILAHVERYECLYGWRMDKEIPKLAYFQVNASSFLSKHGNDEKRFVQKLMKKDIVHFVATDAHSTGHRSPRLLEAGRLIRDEYGAETEARLLYLNPGKVISGEKI